MKPFRKGENANLTNHIDPHCWYKPHDHPLHNQKMAEHRGTMEVSL